MVISNTSNEPPYLRKYNPLGPTVTLVLEWESPTRKERKNRLSMSYLDVGKESEPYELFIFAINAEQTREKYVSRMKFFEIIGIDQEKKFTIPEIYRLFTKKGKS